MILASVLLLAAGSTAPGTPADELIPFGATWRYLDDGSNQGSAWQKPSFDDSTWSAGPAQLGYGDGDESTVVSYGPDPANKHATTYFRLAFDVPDPGAYVALGLELLRDDGVVVYLNGDEVARDNLAAGNVTFDEFATRIVDENREDLAYPFYADAALLVAGANVLAVEVHQVSGSSSDVSFDLRLVGHEDPVVWRGPYLQLATPDSTRIRWRSAPASDAVVWYGPAPGQLTASALDPGVGTEHEVELTGLAPDTTYYYAVGSSDGPIVGGDIEHVFRTPPVPGADSPQRFWVLGDSGTATSVPEQVRDAYLTYSAGTWTDAVLLLGDNAYRNGSDTEYQLALFEMFERSLRKAVFWATRGNHEAVESDYYAMFTLPTGGEAGGLPSGTEAYYSFDRGNVHFVCLDSTGSDRSPNGAMAIWLQADLLANDRTWTVAFWHHPPYSKGSHDSDVETALVEMRENFLPLLEAGGADLVLCGHSHSYERSYLIDGHHGDSTTFGPEHQVDAGTGNEGETGAYVQATGPNAGTVYAVAGSSGKLSSGPLDHPAMVVSLLEYGSMVLDVDGGRLDAIFLTETGAVQDRFTLLAPSYEGAYCAPSVNSEGCEGRLSSIGVPSVNSPGPFVISATGLTKGQAGIFFYGFEPANHPLETGRLCVGPPLTRLAAQPTGGASPCAGTLSVDFNERIQSGVDQGLVVGAVVYCQAWYRDPSGPVTSLFTDALQFTIQP